MTGIQVVLVLLSFLAITFASLIFRSRLWYRLLAVFLFLTALLFVVFPNTTNIIAHRLGVGRGADLLLYVTVFACIHTFLLLYMKIRKLERKTTEQIRSIAIRDAQYLTTASNLDPVRSKSVALG
jgi:hypothetical protein